MSDENKQETQGQEAQGQGTEKQETSLSEQDLKQVTGGAETVSMNFSKIEVTYKQQKAD